MTRIDRSTGWYDDFDPLPSDPDCTHREVRGAYVEQTGRPIALWSCADCGCRFAPRPAGSTDAPMGLVHPYPPLEGSPDDVMRERTMTTPAEVADWHTRGWAPDEISSIYAMSSHPMWWEAMRVLGAETL